MDFSNYLQKRLSAGAIGSKGFGSVTGGSVQDRLKNISLFSSASFEQLNNIDMAKLLAGEVNENASPEEQALGDIVSALMELDGVQGAADLDGDGEVSEAEAQEFLKSIMGNDGDANNFSISDIDKAIEKLGIDLEQAAEDAISEALKPEEEEKAKELEEAQKEAAAQQAAAPSSAGGSGSVGGGGGVSGGGAVNPASTNAAKSKDGDSVEEIEEQIKTEEAKKEDIKTQMEADIAEQEKIISEAMEDKDSGFPEGFKEKYDEEKAKIDEEIKSKDTEIETQNGIIQDKTAQIEAAQTSISSLKDQKSTLEGQLSSVSSDAEDADSQKADIQSKIDNVSKEIETKENDKKEAETAKKEAEDKQKELQNEKQALIEKRDNLLDKMIKENNLEISPEVKEKINAAQDKIKEIRSAAEDDIAASDTKIQDLKTKLEQAKQKEETDKVISENSVYDGNIPKELASAIDAKCGAGFTAKVEEIAKKLNCDPNDLLGMMYSESGLNSKAVNGSSGATGLIQFMPSTAQGLGTSTSALANMSPIEQLDWVEKYYDANKKAAGIPDGQRLEAGQLYALVFLPAYANREVLTTSGEKYYSANSGLDTDKNGDISISDLTQRVKGKYQELYGAWV